MPKGTIYKMYTHNTHRRTFGDCAKFKGTEKRNDHNPLKDRSICTTAEEFYKERSQKNSTHNTQTREKEMKRKMHVRTTKQNKTKTSGIKCLNGTENNKIK